MRRNFPHLKKAPLAQKVMLATLLTLWTLSSACGVTVYQPLRGLQTPTVLNTAETNFEGMRILVRCVVDKENMPQGQADKLCRQMRESFSNQGAECEAVSALGSEDRPKLFEGKEPDLTLEIESKIEHTEKHRLLEYASILTLTAIPRMEEFTFSQRLQVLGKDSSVLAEGVYRVRFVEYTGLGVWTINKLLDWTVRDDDEKMTGDYAKKDFSRDFYRHTRQLVFNAKVRSEVLGLTAPLRQRPRYKRPVAQPAQQPKAPAAQPKAPAARPKALGESEAAEPEAAVADPDAPVAEPEPAEPDAPVAEPEPAEPEPEAEPADPVAEPETEAPTDPDDF